MEGYGFLPGDQSFHSKAFSCRYVNHSEAEPLKKLRKNSTRMKMRSTGILRPPQVRHVVCRPDWQAKYDILAGCTPDPLDVDGTVLAGCISSQYLDNSHIQMDGR